MDYSYNSAGSAAGLIIGFIVGIAFWVAVSWLMYWKVFEKAGKEPWRGLIPIYQFYVIIQIVGRPVWWFWIIVACYVGMLIPILNLIAWIPLFVMVLLIALDMARCFGKSNGFGIGLWLLSIIFYPILGFGDAQYQGPLAAAGYAQPPMGQAMDQPMAPAHVPWQPVPPVPGPAAQQTAPPPPLAQPLTAAPLAPPPPRVAPPTPPVQVAPPAPPPVAEAVEAEPVPAEAEVAEAVTEAAPAEAEAAVETAEEAAVEDAPPEAPTPPPPAS